MKQAYSLRHFVLESLHECISKILKELLFLSYSKWLINYPNILSIVDFYLLILSAFIKDIC